MIMFFPSTLAFFLLCTDFGRTAASEGQNDELDTLGVTIALNGLQPRNRDLQLTPFLTSTSSLAPSTSLVLDPMVPLSPPSPSATSVQSSSYIANTSSSASQLSPSSSLNKPTEAATTSASQARSFISLEITRSSESKKPSKISALGIGSPPSTMKGTFQTPDPAQFGIGPPPAGFKAPAKKSEPKKNTDLNSAPF